MAATYGDAQISTKAQDSKLRIAALLTAGCTASVKGKASSADRDRDELRYLLGCLRRGDTVVVVRICCLARSMAHLLAMLDRMRAKLTPKTSGQ